MNRIIVPFVAIAWTLSLFVLSGWIYAGAMDAYSLRIQVQQRDQTIAQLKAEIATGTPGKRLGYVEVQFEGRWFEMEEFVLDSDVLEAGDDWPSYACTSIAGKRGVKHRSVVLAGEIVLIRDVHQ